MIDISAIEPFAVLHINFAPNRFFGRQYFNVKAQEIYGTRMLEPFIIDAANVIGRIENDIDVIFSFKYLGKPANIGKLDTIAFRSEIFQDPGVFIGSTVDVKVLGVSVNACMMKD